MTQVHKNNPTKNKIHTTIENTTKITSGGKKPSNFWITHEITDIGQESMDKKGGQRVKGRTTRIKKGGLLEGQAAMEKNSCVERIWTKCEKKVTNAGGKGSHAKVKKKNFNKPQIAWGTEKKMQGHM